MSNYSQSDSYSRHYASYRMPPITTTPTRIVPSVSTGQLRSVNRPSNYFRDLELHSTSSNISSYTPTYSSTYSSTYSNGLSVPRKLDYSTRYLPPSYNDKDSHSERGNNSKLSYTDGNSTELQKPGKRYLSAGFCGLRNLGNTCFMSSAIQCLSNTKLLLEYILNGEYRKDLNTTTSTCKGALVSNFADLLMHMWDGVSTCVSPSPFKSAIQQFAPRFSGYNQQDSQEFLRYLLQGLQEDVNHVKQRLKVKPLDDKAISLLPVHEQADIYWQHYHKFEDSKIVDIFVGQLRSSLICQICGHESVAFDPFWDLSLPVPKGYSTRIDLMQCINNFMKEEILDGQEKARCDNCQKLQKCTKRFSIHRFPNVLVLHLKRFSQGSYGSKLETLVDFPVTGLNLSKFCDSARAGNQVPFYDLYAVSNHSGTMYSGHYTAFAKHPYDSRWYEYNDSRVSTISSRALVSSGAYILFYEQSNQ